MTDLMLTTIARILTIYLISVVVSHLCLRDLLNRQKSDLEDLNPYVNLEAAANVICFIPVINTLLSILFIVNLLYRAVQTVRLAASEKRLEQHVERLIGMLDKKEINNVHKVVDQMLASGRRILVVVSIGDKPDDVSIASIDSASDDEVISALNEAIDMFRDKNNCTIMRIPPSSNPGNN